MWWHLWNIGVPSLVAALYLVDGLARRRRRLRHWQESARMLSEVERSHLLAWRARITARSGPLEVRVTSARGSKEDVIVEIEGLEDSSGLKLRRELLKLWARDVEVGDEKLDDAYIVDGPVRRVGALLDAAMRRQLVQASNHCPTLEIADGRLLAETSEKALSHVLPLLLQISERYNERVDEERQIARNVRDDPQPGVRLFNLLLLARERPGDPETLKVLRFACSDRSPAVRLRAAIELGEDGRDVLLKLAKHPKDDASSAQAVSHLGGKLPFERARDILSHALREGFPQTARACLEVLGRRRDVAVGVLARVLEEEKGELAIDAARALGATGEEAAEAPLLQALQSEESDLREAAATALGQVGSVAAVQPLKDAVERFWLDLGFRRAARQAIAGIQARLEGASPGQLSLAEAEAGQLSLAPFEAGQLSLAPEAGPSPLTQDESGPAGRRV